MNWKLLIGALVLTFALPAQAQDWATLATEKDVVFDDFEFASGERMDLRMHVTTLGTPHRGADGRIDNAVMVLHGTGGSGAQFFRPQFADELYGPGQPLDITRYYVILPDNIGHGRSSKPSDGLRMAFPRYGYTDMINAQKRLVEEGLGVARLKLILGTSMGCMHAFMWGEAFPGFAERLAPFGCNAVEIAGRNRIWRQMSIEAIKADPAWNGGNYTSEPEQGLRTARDLNMLAGANASAWQAQYPTREQAEAYLTEGYATASGNLNEANDIIYQLDSSRDYNPATQLSRITVPVLWVNSADDFINPPELGLAEQQVKEMPHAKFVLIPASPETKGHGTHTWAKFWKTELAQLLAD